MALNGKKTLSETVADYYLSGTNAGKKNIGNQLPTSVSDAVTRQLLSGSSAASKSSSNKNTSTKWSPVDSSSLYGNSYDYSSYGSGGYGGFYTLDPSAMIAAYQQQAAADRDAAKATYETTRNDLLTSLKRFQEENAQQQANQRKSYLTGQASLESAREQADRQSRISAAARGLGGSGLQQLAQLQNLLNQGQDISNLATSNQSAMDKLRTLLAQKEEDTDTNLNKATTAYNNALNQISATLAKNIAEAEMARANSYVSGGGGSSSSYGDDGLSWALKDVIDAYNNNTDYGSKGNKLTWKTATSAINNIASNYGASSNNAQVQNALNQVQNIRSAIGAWKKRTGKKSR